MGILDKIKSEAQKQGSSKSKFFYVKDGEKRRVRFLQDMEDGFEVDIHSNYTKQFTVPCQELFGRSCRYCEDTDPDTKTRTNFAWSVYDYDSNEVRILMFPMNNCTPIGAIASAYDTYGTLLDRDYVIGVTGKQTNKVYTVMPMDKNKFRNSQAKPYSKSNFLKVLDAAYPDKDADGGFEQDSEDKDHYKRRQSKKGDDGFMNAPDPIDYSEMTPKQLYELCEEREIEAEPKMKAKYYITLLEEYDNEMLSDGTEESEDEWEDEESQEDYSDMTAKELFKLCKDRGIEALPKKPEKYYIGLLQENDKAHDDWDEEGEWEE